MARFAAYLLTLTVVACPLVCRGGLPFQSGHASCCCCEHPCSDSQDYPIDGEPQDEPRHGCLCNGAILGDVSASRGILDPTLAAFHPGVLAMPRRADDSARLIDRVADAGGGRGVGRALRIQIASWLI